MKIFLLGFMGSGKTYRGRQLSQKLGLPFFDLDEVIMNHTGKSITDIFAMHGEEEFRMLEKKSLHLITETNDKFIMACGGGTPCYYNNIEYLRANGLTVWMNPSVQIIFQRLREEKLSRPLIKNVSDDELMQFIIKKIADRKIFYEQATLIIDENALNVDELAKLILYG